MVFFQGFVEKKNLEISNINTLHLSTNPKNHLKSEMNQEKIFNWKSKLT